MTDTRPAIPMDGGRVVPARLFAIRYSLFAIRFSPDIQFENGADGTTPPAMFQAGADHVRAGVRSGTTLTAVA